MNTIHVNTQDLEVAKMINSYFVAFIGERKQDDWKHDKWIVTINGVDFEYMTGTGLRLELPKNKHKLSAAQTKQAKELKECTGLSKVLFTVEDGSLYAVAPTQASVLHSIVMDSYAEDVSFSDWCGDFGYDEDSRKHLDVYLACQANAKKLREVFKKTHNGREKLEQLKEILEDY